MHPWPRPSLSFMEVSSECSVQSEYYFIIVDKFQNLTCINHLTAQGVFFKHTFVNAFFFSSSQWLVKAALSAEGLLFTWLLLFYWKSHRKLLHVPESSLQSLGWLNGLQFRIKVIYQMWVFQQSFLVFVPASPCCSPLSFPVLVLSRLYLNLCCLNLSLSVPRMASSVNTSFSSFPLLKETRCKWVRANGSLIERKEPGKREPQTWTEGGGGGEGLELRAVKSSVALIEMLSGDAKRLESSRRRRRNRRRPMRTKGGL